MFKGVNLENYLAPAQDDGVDMPEERLALKVNDVEDALLPLVSRPARYQPLIMGLRERRSVEVEAVVVAPDLLEAAIMHPVVPALYHGLFAAGAGAELAFLPWIDFEDELRRHDLPLYALESRRPLNRFPLVIIPVLRELQAAGVVEILDLGRIPIRAAERGPDDPVVVGAGPALGNPEPFADFFDAVLLGDSEAILRDLVGVMKHHPLGRSQRSTILDQLAEVQGVYVPARVPVVAARDGRLVAAAGTAPVTARYTQSVPPPAAPLQPLMEARGDVFEIEVQRGCPRRCRFCQPARVAGEVRELSPDQVLAAMGRAVRGEGWQELALGGLMPCDWSHLDTTIEPLGRQLFGTGVALSLGAAAGERVSKGVLAELSRVRRTTLAFAPEAGSERLRRVIGKPLDEDALLEAVGQAARLGWPSVKLHFMIGLPTETDDDLRAIAELCDRVCKAGSRPGSRFAVQVTIHPFVPRAHTPLQWEAQLPLDEMRRRVKRLRGLLNRRALRLRWGHPESAQLEALLARGDRRLGPVIGDAYRAGARLDSWSELVRPAIWWRVLAEAGLDLATELGPRATDHPLPWSHLALGEGEAHLAAEREAAHRGEISPLRPIVLSLRPQPPGAEGLFAQTPLALPADEPGAGGAGAGATAAAVQARAGLYGRSTKRRRVSRQASRRHRVRFAKTEPVRFISHLDTVRLLDRALRRAGITVAYSTGYSRHPKFSFGPPLPVGMVGLDEYFDVELVDERPAEFVELLNTHLPAGIQVLEAEPLLSKVQSLMSLIDHADYRLSFTPHVRRLLGDPDSIPFRASLDEAIRHFFSHDRAFIMQRGPDGERPVELTSGVRRLAAVQGDDAFPVLELALRIAGDGAVRPLDLAGFLLGHLLGEDRLDPKLLRVARLRLYHVRGDHLITPFDAVAGEELVGALSAPGSAGGPTPGDGRPDVQRDRYQRRSGRDTYRHTRRW